LNGNILIKPSVQQKFDSVMQSGRILFSVRPAALAKRRWPMRCCAGIGRYGCVPMRRILRSAHCRKTGMSF